MTYSFDSTIKIHADYAADLPSIHADSTQIEMILSAILSNSSEAMKGQGNIRISTYSRCLDGEFANDKDIRAGTYVGLRIEDDGEGMDEEMRNRIFEPFSTTKFQGRGLGMASVHGVVANHNGHITVDSALGEGTTVDICLPAVERSEDREEGRDQTEHSRNVLVVEDEEMVMQVTSALLRRLDYTALPAMTGKEAIDIVNNYEGDISHALLDIKLPDMGGDAVYPHIRKARPDTKVYVCSGYSIDGPAQEIIDAGAEGLIQKPFTMKQLSQRLGESIESTEATQDF